MASVRRCRRASVRAQRAAGLGCAAESSHAQRAIPRAGGACGARTLIRVTSRASLIELGLVVLGGAVGSLGRAAVSAALAAPTDGRGLPFATLLVNVTGAFALGLLVEVIAHRSDPARRRIRLLLGTGLLGGFTTYSLLAGELAESLLAGRYALAAVYAAATLLGGALASWLGLLAGRGIAQAGARDAQGAGPQGAGPHR